MKTSRRRVAFSVLRTLQVFAVVALHARFGGRDADDPRRRRARVLADAFESLGTTYVKIAQFLTTRPDVVPPVYIDELQRLQDDVEPEASADVVDVLESELGPVDEVFDEFEREPVSAASVAQVHRARVAGEEVAVKVQRPGLRESVDADLRAFRWIVRGVVALMRLAGHAAHAGTLVSVALDVEDSLRREVDFEREAALMDELRRGVEADGFDTEVVVPRLYPGLSTSRVITMSYEPGVKLKHPGELVERGHDLGEVSRRVVEAYLRMAFVYGVLQTDPHHGNLAVADDGRLVVYDYGMAQRPGEHVRDAFARLLVGLGLRDSDVVVAALEDLDATEIRSRSQWRAMTRWADALAHDVAGETDEIDLGEVARGFSEAFDEFPLQMNQDLLFSMRSITGVQGLASSLDPSYDFRLHLASFFVDREGFDLDLEDVRRDSRARSDRLYVEEARDDVVEAVEATRDDVGLLLLGSTFALGGGVVYIATSSLPPSLGLAFAGVACYVAVYRRRDGDGRVHGPMFMMRYEMERWGDPGPEFEMEGEQVESDVGTEAVRTED